MARVIDIEHRLRRWAQALVAGDASGYPAMNTIHPNWQPPTSGITPTLKVSSTADVREMTAAIKALPQALQATLLVHYVMRWPMVMQAEKLGCQQRTVYERISTAHRLLVQALGQK